MVLYKGTHGILLVMTIVKDGSVVDLTGLNARLILEGPNGVDLVRNMAVLDPTNGVVAYEVQPDDFTVTGRWRGQVELYNDDMAFWTDQFGIVVLPTLQET